MKTVSIIVPVYNEAEAIAVYFDTINKVENKVPKCHFEYWLIDDGSADNTVGEIKKIQKVKPNVNYVSFSRNFGKEAALYAGLEHATGDFVVVMDVDLQDPPELLPQMISDVYSGQWDCVGTRRTTRSGEPPIRTFFSNLFYKVINKISNTHFVNGARDFRVMNRTMANAVLKITERNRFSKGIFEWVGFKTKYIPYENVERVAGNTSWSFLDLMKYSIEGIVSFSTVPLLIISIIGAISFMLSILMILFIVVRAFLMPRTAINGWPSTISIFLLMGGIQLLSLGVVGRYISSIFLEVKRRPVYIAREVSKQ
ncbi:glycosyltransferase family 2 protein [Leuconostoc citreum]|uniref:glycosyltransferase family 2 protein n=1 Tax=Leuconostoc citreum TaxID=33964 RepID=UPI0032DFE5C5